MHNVEHYTYDENINRSKVQKELDHYVAVADAGEGATGLPNNIRWLDREPICLNYEAAEKKIEQKDSGWYDCLAVRYYEPMKYESKKFSELKNKRLDAYDDYLKKEHVTWAKNLTSEYVSCRHCGSKLKRNLLFNNVCPVCKQDLRPDTTLKIVEAAKRKWAKLDTDCKNYEQEHAPKTVKWLVKIEYHT